VDITLINALMIVGIGLAAGILGGLLGIGGSIVMIPLLALVFHDATGSMQQLFQASAMAVNVIVSAPAALMHRKAGTVRMDVVRVMLPAVVITIILGVLVSNNTSGMLLRRMFAVFLLYVSTINIIKIFRKIKELHGVPDRATPLRVGSIGSLMGFVAGLLGIGGGVLAVPLMQTVARLPLRQCIGTSSAIMAIASIVGATFKIGTLGSVENGQFAPLDALLIAAILTPTAFIGGWFGATLTHRLPLEWVRCVFAAALLVAAWRMSGL
jgi:uncharacterized membrane protein YfcA